MSVIRYTYACKITIAITSLVLVCTTGCTKQYEYDSAKHLKNAKELLARPSITNEDWRTIEYHLVKVDKRSTSYKDAQKFLPEIQAKVNQLNNDKKELEAADNVVIKLTKEQLTNIYSDKWLNQYRTATQISFIGKNKSIMKVMVNFQHDQAVKVIHDYSLIEAAKNAGIKRIEFHDWSGFSKEYLSHDIE